MSKQLITHLETIFKKTPGKKTLKDKFIKRAWKGNLTRDEDPETHFCVYFAAYDPGRRQVFIGHHKKSGLWLFNGGHIDKGEQPVEALMREAREEWGEKVAIDNLGEPKLLTLTEIEKPEKQICRWHYDIWYFVSMRRDVFSPDEDLLAKEFHQTSWQTVSQARRLVSDDSTMLALAKLEKFFIK